MIVRDQGCVANRTTFSSISLLPCPSNELDRLIDFQSRSAYFHNPKIDPNPAHYFLELAQRANCIFE